MAIGETARGFKEINESSTPPPGLHIQPGGSPDDIARNLIKRLGPHGAEPHDMGVSAGFGLGLAAHDQPGADFDHITECAMYHVDQAHLTDEQARATIAAILFNKGLSDEWYPDEEAAHISSLGSIGKAEYAKQCLNQDMTRWKVAIVAIGQQLKNADAVIEALHKARTEAIEQETMYADLQASYRERSLKQVAAKREALEQKLQMQGQSTSISPGLGLFLGDHTTVATGKAFPDYPISSTRSSSSTIGETSLSNPATGSTSAFYQPPTDSHGHTKSKRRRTEKHSRKRLSEEETSTKPDRFPDAFSSFDSEPRPSTLLPTPKFTSVNLDKLDTAQATPQPPSDLNLSGRATAADFLKNQLIPHSHLD